MENKEKLLGFLGIILRSRRLICGTELVNESIRYGKAKLVLSASDISANTEKRLEQCCSYYRAERIKTEITMAEFSHALGKAGAVAALSVTDESMANRVRQYFN